jgi:hypothetical protein
MYTTIGLDFVYFHELLTNSIRYAFQLNTFALPTPSQASVLGYSIPAGATWALPTSPISPQITICSGLAKLLGFTTLTFPSTYLTAVTQSFLSEISPTISPVNSYLMTLNLINSKYSIPNNIFAAIPLTSKFGDMITQTSSNIVYNDISPGRYQYIQIDILDQNYSKIKLNDTDLVIVLAIQED